MFCIKEFTKIEVTSLMVNKNRREVKYIKNKNTILRIYKFYLDVRLYKKYV